MARFIPTLIGLVIVVVGFALSSGIITTIGLVLFVGGIAWFVMNGTHTRLDREVRNRSRS
jgi:uncharacterized membrane protein